MPAQFFGAQGAVTILNRAFTNTSSGFFANANQVTNAEKAGLNGPAEETLSYLAFAADFGKPYAAKHTEAELSKLLLTNMGVLPSTVTEVVALEKALAEYITANGKGNIGIIALQLGTILSAIETDTIYGAAAKAWNTEINASANYSLASTNVANFTGEHPDLQSLGKTFSLTTGADDFTPTSSNPSTVNNDSYKGVVSTVAGDNTLNSSDILDAGLGNDTLNLLFTASNANFPAGVTIKGIEVVTLTLTGASNANFLGGNASSFLNSSNYEGVKELWQVHAGSIGSEVGSSFKSVSVGEGVVAGFRGNNATGVDGSGAADASVTVTNNGTTKALTIALDGIGGGSAITASAGTAKVETLTIKGSVAGDSSTVSGILKIDAGADALTLNGEFTSGVNIPGASIAGAAIKTIDLSKSTGGVTLDASTFTAKLETIKGGAGKDALTVDLGVKLATVDLGAGNDTLKLLDATKSDGDDKGVSVTLGAGKDTLKIGAVTDLQNVKDTADLTKGLVTVTDFKLGEDTIELTGAGGMTLTSAQLGNAKDAATLKAAVEGVALITKAAIKTAAVFSYGGDAYIFIDNATTGEFKAGDGLIKLVGVDATLMSTDQNGGLVL